MKTQSDTGIILRRIDYGEADRIITFLTATNGKIRAIAKGVRKSRSKLAGGIELFSVSELHFIKGKGDIDTLMSTRLIRHYGEIVKDLERTELAYRFIKQIDKAVEDGTGQEYFDILDESLAALDDPKITLTLAELSFYARMLKELGHVPEFSADSKGRALNPEGTYQFDYESVSFAVHPEGQFNKNHLKVIKLLSLNSPKAVAKITDIDKYCQEIAPLIKSLAANSLNQ